jgi:hypothetical protein
VRRFSQRSLGENKVAGEVRELLGPDVKVKSKGLAPRCCLFEGPLVVCSARQRSGRVDIRASTMQSLVLLAPTPFLRLTSE